MLRKLYDNTLRSYHVSEISGEDPGEFLNFTENG